MFDLHCHLLPGIDDGASDMGASVAMAKILERHGFEGIAPSPHFGEGPGGHVGKEMATEKRQELKHRLEKEGIALTLYPNAEHHFTPKLLDYFETGEVTPIGGNTSWVLLELPWHAVPNLKSWIFKLRRLRYVGDSTLQQSTNKQLPQTRAQARAYSFLLAHPERYKHIRTQSLIELSQQGMAFQGELGSLVGLYGSSVERRVRRLLDEGCIQVLATDMHRPEKSNEWLPKALAVLKNDYGEEAATRLLPTNPREILNDGAL